MGARGFSNYRPVQYERCKNCLGLYFVQVEPNSPRLYCFIWEVQKSDLQFQPLFFSFFLILPGKGQGIRDRVLV